MAVLSQPIPRRFLLNSGSIFAGEALARGATFLVAVVVARAFGPVALGEYGFAVAMMSVLLLVPDAGLHLFVVRELAASPERLRPVFWGVHWLKLPLLGAVLAFSILFCRFAVHDDGRRLFLLLLTAKVVLQTFSQAYMAIFKAFERMHYIAVQQLANAGLTGAWVGAALLLNANLPVVVLGLVVGQGLETWIGWRFVGREFSPGVPSSWDGSTLRRMLLAGAPIGVAAILQALNLRLDILTLGPFASNRTLGSYQAAAWFPVGAYLLVSLLMTALFPKLARLVRNSGKRVNDYVANLLKIGVVVMTASSILLELLAPHLLKVLFGGGLEASALSLRILLIVFPFIFMNTAMFYVFVAAHKRKAYLSALLVGLVAGGTLSVAFSAKYGPNGTALACVIREVIVSAVYLGFLMAGDLAKSAQTAIRLLACCAVGLMILDLLLTSSIVLGAAWSIALVAAIALSLRGSRLEEILLLAGDNL